MKRTFLTILPIAAALLLATSCSKDSDNDVETTPDSTVPVQEQVAEDNQTQAIPFSITVGKDSESLSKATLKDGTSTTQVFEIGDQLVLKKGKTEVATLDLTEGDGQTTATFSGKLTTDGITSGSTISVTLKNDDNGNTGTALTAPQTASTLAEAFQKYGYWTSSFVYKEGEAPTISLTQNTAFLNINLPFSGARIDVATGTGKATAIYVGSKQAVAIPNGATIESPALNINETTIDVLKNVVYNIRNTGAKKRELPVDCIAGLFSVDEDKQIFFSKGNLQASTTNKGINWTWGFAANQWGYIGWSGANHKIIGDGKVSESDIVDLFGWVGATSKWEEGGALYGISNSTNYYDYGNRGGYYEKLKSDWGKVFGKSSKWYTLSTWEWRYLLGNTDERKGKYGIGKVHNRLGLIILPDGYIDPADVSQPFVAGTTTTAYSDADWKKMESAGAVFLPAAGYREGAEIFYPGVIGYYWSSTRYYDTNSYGVVFGSNEEDYRYFTSDVGVDPSYAFWGYHGQSVRLVYPLSN